MITELLILSASTYRLTYLLVKEDGPGGLSVWLNEKAYGTFFGEVLECFYCTSYWIALALTFLAASINRDISLYGFMFMPLAASALAMVAFDIASKAYVNNVTGLSVSNGSFVNIGTANLEEEDEELADELDLDQLADSYLADNPNPNGF